MDEAKRGRVGQVRKGPDQEEVKGREGKGVWRRKGKDRGGSDGQFRAGPDQEMGGKVRGRKRSGAYL